MAPKTKLAIVRGGNPGHRSKADIESSKRQPLVDKSIPFREPEWPTDVASRARQLYRALRPVLEREVGLIGAQQECLVQYCITTARVESLDRLIAEEGYTVVGAKGSLVRNPNLATQMTLLNLSCKLRIELGLSPAAALKLPAPTKGGVGAALAEEEAAFD